MCLPLSYPHLFKRRPGLLNPLQHMKDVNVKSTKIKLNFMGDSVAFLEKFTRIMNHDLLKPTSECFRNINADKANYEIAWNNSITVSIDDIKNTVNADC